MSQLCYEVPVCCLLCEQCGLLLHSLDIGSVLARFVFFFQYLIILPSKYQSLRESEGGEKHICCLPEDREAVFIYNESDRTTWFNCMKQQNGKS